MASRRYDAADSCEHVLGNQEYGDEKMEAGSAMKVAAEQGFKLLDKVTEFRFALAILSVVIAIDVALAWIANRNILSMDWSTLSAGGFAKLGLAVVIYVFWMAALSPLVRYVVEFVFSLLGNTRLGSAFGSVVEPEHETAERRYAWGRVRVNDAKLRALKDKDTFWIAQVEKAEAKEIEQRNEMAELASLSFSVAGLLMMDWWSEHSIVGEVAAWLGGHGGRMGSFATLGAWICMLVIAFPWLCRVRAGYPGDAWMEHPELAKERLEAVEVQRRNAHL
jgi:hypothetical protein